MKFLIAGLVATCLFLGSLAEETRLIELEPDDAAQIINKQDQALRYASKIESNVPGVRFIGEHPEHVVQDIYLANQYHGQDGLGAYIYGYSVPDISKTEKKERSGDLKGAYNYIAGNGQEIKVEYWDDGTGFHQIDNIPQIQPKQIEDSPEVKAAKEEHLRIWREQAERNSHAPVDPYSEQYNHEPQQSQNQYQQQGQAHAYGQAQAHHHSASGPNLNNVDYSGQYSSNQPNRVQGPNAQQVSASTRQEQRQQQEEEVTGPPKGFFYSFDYAVPIIVGREGKNLEAYYSQNKNLYEKQLKGEAPRSGGASHSFAVSA